MFLATLDCITSVTLACSVYILRDCEDLIWYQAAIITSGRNPEGYVVCMGCCVRFATRSVLSAVHIVYCAVCTVKCVL